MSWNVGQKLYRDKKLIELLGDRAGRWGQAVFGDAYVLEKDLYGGAWSETWLASHQGQKYLIKSLKHEIVNHPENQDLLNRPVGKQKQCLEGISLFLSIFKQHLNRSSINQPHSALDGHQNRVHDCDKLLLPSYIASYLRGRVHISLVDC